MYYNPIDLPEGSPLSTLNKEEIPKNIETLKNRRDPIEEALQELLRK